MRTTGIQGSFTNHRHCSKPGTNPVLSRSREPAGDAALDEWSGKGLSGNIRVEIDHWGHSTISHSVGQGGTGESAFLSSSQVMLMVLAEGPHFAHCP